MKYNIEVRDYLIVTLCGSTKFKKEFEYANKLETLKGNIVLSVGFFAHLENIHLTYIEKKNLDKLHFDKIKISDYILVIDKDGYIGESTRNEIEYAKKLNIPVKYLSQIEGN